MTKLLVDFNRLTSEIEEDKSFILPSGEKIRSLSRLASLLPSLDDNFFKEHVNSEKNDFANWIAHCFEDELLSERIRKLQTKQEMADEIKTRIEQAKISLKLKPQPSQEQNSPTPPQSLSESLTPPTLEPSLDSNLDLSLDNSLDSDLTAPQPPVTNNQETKVEEKIEIPKPTVTPQEPTLEPSLDLNLDTSLEPALEPSPEPTLDQTPSSAPKIEPLPEHIIPKLPESTPEKTQEPIKLQTPEPALTPIPPLPTKQEVLDNLKPVDSPPQIETLKQTPAEPPKLQPPQPTPQPEQEKTVEPVKTAKTEPNPIPIVAETPKPVETPIIIETPKPAEAPPQPTLNISQPAPAFDDTGLSDEEKLILRTDNKELNPKQLFKKIKLQKTIAARTPQKTTVITPSAKEEKKPEQKITDDSPSPVDLLALSEEEFHSLIGVNLKDEFIATTSKKDIVTQKIRKHLKTGVPGFDELIEKGILEGSSVLVSGGPGSGKTTFSIQQLGFAAEHGEKCLFISLEEKEERLVEHMKGYGLNPEKYLRDGNLKIKKLDSFKLARSVEALLAHARGELMIDVAPVLDIIPDGYKPDRVVLDSLSSIAAAFAGKPEEYRIYVEQLFNIFEQIGATSFIITEIQGSESMGHGGVEDFLADGVVNFYNMRKGTLRQPAVEVLKMRGVAHKKKVVPFNFISGKGLEIYPLEEVFHGD